MRHLKWAATHSLLGPGTAGLSDKTQRGQRSRPSTLPAQTWRSGSICLKAREMPGAAYGPACLTQ